MMEKVMLVHIIWLEDIGSKLKSFRAQVFDHFLVHLAFNSLPDQSGQLKFTYNASRESGS